MTTNARLARTQPNGTIWYPAADGTGWTTNVDYAGPYYLDADDAPAVTVPELPAKRLMTPLEEDEAITAHNDAQRPRSAHAHCTHATTPAARRACRKARGN